MVWVLLTSEYVEGKTERRNRLVDPKSGHDKSVFPSVMQIVELIISLFRQRWTVIACSAVDGRALLLAKSEKE